MPKTSSEWMLKPRDWHARETRARAIDLFYAARDPFYKEGVPRELLRSWQDAGGQAEYVFISDHSLRRAAVAANAPVWERQADASEDDRSS